MLRRLAAAALVAFATVAPASAAIVTYNVSTTTADFSGGGSFGFADGSGPLSLNATFTIDTLQGFVTPFGFAQQMTGSPLVSSHVSDNGAGLPSALANIASSSYWFGGEVVQNGSFISARDQFSTDVLDANGVVIGGRRIDVASQLRQQSSGPFQTVDGISFPIPQVGDLIRLQLGYVEQIDYFDGVTPSMIAVLIIDATGIYGAQASDSFNISSEGPTDAPEPASLALLGLGLAGVAVRQRRRVAA